MIQGWRKTITGDLNMPVVYRPLKPPLGTSHNKN
jgi:hypothetical protein